VAIGRALTPYMAATVPSSRTYSGWRSSGHTQPSRWCIFSRCEPVACGLRLVADLVGVDDRHPRHQDHHGLAVLALLGPGDELVAPAQDLADVRKAGRVVIFGDAGKAIPLVQWIQAHDSFALLRPWAPVPVPPRELTQ